MMYRFAIAPAYGIPLATCRIKTITVNHNMNVAPHNGLGSDIWIQQYPGFVTRIIIWKVANDSIFGGLSLSPLSRSPSSPEG